MCTIIRVGSGIRGAARIGLTFLLFGGMAPPAAAQGVAWAWGENSYDQLGDGTYLDSNVPVPVSGLTGIGSMAGAAWHSIALRSDRTVWSWGRNIEGELGDGTTTDRSLPVRVIGLTDVSAIAANNNHNMALRRNSTVWSWGDNTYGQAGNGVNGDFNSAPVQVVGRNGIGFLNNVTAIACGSLHSLAVLSNDTVVAWGNNDFGTLGDGTTALRSTPDNVVGVNHIRAVAAGEYHSLALKDDGTVWAWGSNLYGQIGDGTTTDRYTAVRVNGLSGIIAIACGGWHSLALRNDGTVWAWGSNVSGGLGDGTLMDRSIPVRVLRISRIVEIAGGAWHSVARRSDGAVLTWGLNRYGQLGDGSSAAYRTAPVQVVGLTRMSGIAAGGLHCLAFTSNASRIIVTNILGQIGMTTTLKAVLRRSDTNAVVPGKPVQFSIDGVDVGSSVTTNGGGIAALSYLVPEALAIGSHTVGAAFAGDADYAPSSGTGTLTISKGPVRMTVPGVTGRAGSTVSLTARLANGANVALIGAVLDFNVAGNSAGQGNTNNAGVATVGYMIPSGTAPGRYLITVTFTGDSRYLPGTKTGYLTVR